MKLLPPAGPARRRQVVLLGLLLVVLAIVVWQFVLPRVPTAPAMPASNTQARPLPAADGQTPLPLPEPVKLEALEPVPDAPEAGRNLFTFGVRPPPIPLKLVTLWERPDGKREAVLKDPATGAIFRAIEGMVVDGRYKVVKVANVSVIVSYLDGSGLRTLGLGQS